MVLLKEKVRSDLWARDLVFYYSLTVWWFQSYTHLKSSFLIIFWKRPFVGWFVSRITQKKKKKTEKIYKRDARYIRDRYVIGLMMEHLHYQLSADKEIIADNTKTFFFFVDITIAVFFLFTSTHMREKVFKFNHKFLSTPVDYQINHHCCLHSGVHKESIKMFLLLVILSVSAMRVRKLFVIVSASTKLRRGGVWNSIMKIRNKNMHRESKYVINKFINTYVEINKLNGKLNGKWIINWIDSKVNKYMQYKCMSNFKY